MDKLFNTVKLSPRLIFVILTLLFIITYWRVPFIFFVQDEWQVLGLVIDQGLGIVLRGLGDEKIFHFIPVNNFLNFLSFKLFHLQYPLYNIAGLLFHLANGLLVYKLSKVIFDSARLALISSVVFITSAIPSQLIMWPVVSLNTISLSFALLAWISMLEIRDIKNYWNLGIAVAFFVLLSLLTLEYSIGLLVFIPLVASIYLGRRRIKQIFAFLLPLFLIIFIYFGLRLYPILYSPYQSSISPVAKANLSQEKIIEFPVRYFAQTFIPQRFIEDYSNILSLKFNKPPEYFFITGTFFFGVIILSVLLSLIFFRKSTKRVNHWRENLVVPTLFVLCASLPFLFIPGLAGRFDLYPPRYLYFGLVGSSLLITSLAALAFSTRKKIILLIPSLFLLSYIGFNIKENWRLSDNLYRNGQMRLGILREIKEKYPVLPQKTVFYTESDATSYGLPPEERIFPFQSGFGQTLLVWYYESEKFPKEFYQDKFLWEITDEEYKEAGLKGFGYFRNFDKLVKVVLENGIDPDSVFAFSYDSKEYKLTDITHQTRGEISGFIARKIRFNLSRTSINFSHNPAHGSLAFDDLRDSYWSSEVPYSIKPQYLEVDFQKKVKIAQIRLDSFTNRDQNEVGYVVSLSENGQDWKEVFRTIRRPPRQDGFVDIYLPKVESRFIRLDQIGYHAYAPWVIHELQVYEATN